jgi:Zn-dependent peptidase ImmA (M78 family)
MAVSRRRSSIKKQAREVLSRLYRIYYEENGKYLSPDQFFPVNLNKIISSVMGWELECVSDVGHDRYGQRLRGHCDHKDRLIRIASQDIHPGERVFTIAHEIGHAMLNEHAPCIQTVHARKRVTPRIANTTLTNKERKIEREADIFAVELLLPEKAVRDCFFRIFGKKKIWLGSPKAQKVIRDFCTASRTSLFASYSAKDIAPCFVDYKKSGIQQSLREFFGVSRSAMSLRLLELNLLYE